MNKPNLRLPQLYALYSNEVNIDHSLIHQVLQLPKTVLINDLDLIVKDSIENFHYYKNINLSEEEKCFPIYALLLLSELRADSTSFSAFLSQLEEFHYFWGINYSKDLMWQIIFSLGSNKLDFLRNLLLNQTNSPELNNAVTKAVSQIALHQPEKREEIVNWYKGILHHHIQNHPANFNYSAPFLATVVSNILDFWGVELYNEVSILFDLKRIDESICGNKEDFTSELRTSTANDFKRKINNIYEHFDIILKEKKFHNGTEERNNTYNFQSMY